MPNNQPTDGFREDLLAVLFHARILQMMITVMKENGSAKSVDEYKVIARLSKEVFVKADWFCGVVDKILNDEELRQMLKNYDEKISDIANMASFIANFRGDLSNEVNFWISEEHRKQFLWHAWRSAQLDVADVVPNRDTFERWYEKTFPNKLSSLQKPTNATTADGR